MTHSPQFVFGSAPKPYLEEYLYEDPAEAEPDPAADPEDLDADAEREAFKEKLRSIGYTIGHLRRAR